MARGMLSSLVPLFALCCLLSVGCVQLNAPDSGTRELGGQPTYAGDYYPGAGRHGSWGFNPFVNTVDDPLSTFAVDVDAGSYTFGRKKISEGHLPAFTHAHPNVRIAVQNRTTPQIVAMLTEGAADVGIVALPITAHGLVTHEPLRCRLERQTSRRLYPPPVAAQPLAA